MRGFFRTMLRDHLVGAFAASSSYVVRRVLDQIRPGDRTFIEYGPGDGVATRAVLARLPADGRLDVVEHNAQFANTLRAAIHDSRVLIEQGDAVLFAARRAHTNPRQTDFVYSSIPLTFLSRADRDLLFAKTHTLLKPTGVFVIFHQYSLISLSQLRKYFRHVEWQFEFRNVFPCFVVIARP